MALVFIKILIESVDKKPQLTRGILARQAELWGASSALSLSRRAGAEKRALAISLAGIVKHYLVSIKHWDANLAAVIQQLMLDARQRHNEYGCWTLSKSSTLYRRDTINWGISPGGRRQAVISIGKVFPIPVGRQLKMWWWSCWSIVAPAMSACNNIFEMAIKSKWRLPWYTWKSRRSADRAGWVWRSWSYLSLTLARRCRKRESPRWPPPNLYI